MSTKTIVDRVQMKAKAWPRDGVNSICQIISEVQNEMFGAPCRATTFIDPTTGDYPFLATVAGQFSYDLPNVSVVIDGISTPRPVRLRMCTELFTRDIMVFQEYPQLLRYMPRFIEEQHGKIVIYSTNTEALGEGILSTGQTGATPARVIFPYDPGNTTNTYQIEALIEPIQVTADTIPLMVGKKWEDAIMDGVLGKIEYQDYGESNRLQTFREYWLPLFYAAYKSTRDRSMRTVTEPRKF